ncbi:MAG TPA: GatB/YqeY domain-containing protein [Mycobacteriales bacterium]|nr:GatB/YqeY domain-containing protein [Mycobacteriales bacterium]
MSELKERLQADLTGAIRARDEVTTATLRMALAAVTTEEVAGTTARTLSDDEVLRVLAREAKKRREAAEAFDSADRPELAGRERAEGAVLERYLPAQLDDAQVTELVRAAIEEAGATGMAQMGAVMKAAQARAAGRADGRRLSTEARRQLTKA